MEALDDDETSGVVDSRIRDDGENEVSIQFNPICFFLNLSHWLSKL
ncbi:unnamed protein product [Schistosoma mattheei]|uniref:Uncharacterized protein n=1 Tax=Schistosoma mattheei TaxID=31246 RepID=A0A183PNL4_9TREM|nr:unnamed protein product [Schistosoma mattheei]